MSGLLQRLVSPSSDSLALLARRRVIPGSQYFRSYCDRCRSPIRVDCSGLAAELKGDGPWCDSCGEPWKPTEEYIGDTQDDDDTRCVSVVLHVGFVFIAETEDMVAALRNERPVDGAPVRSRFTRTAEVQNVQGVNSLAERVTGLRRHVPVMG